MSHQSSEGADHVRVVIPCYNHGAFVGEAVASALAQERADVEVVLVDDGSDDASTPGVCDALAGDRVRVIHQANAGLPAARNAGANGADAPFLVFLDADDWIEPGFCGTLIDNWRSAGDGAVSHVYCQERLTGKAHGVWTVPDWDAGLLAITNLHPVTALVRRDRFEAVGGFDEAMRDGYEDWDLWLRFAARGWRGLRVREPLFNWRRHSDDTMIMDAVKRHGELYRRLIENHRAFYEARALDLLARSNDLLRSADANWLDEELRAIAMRDLRAWVADLVPERDEARARVAQLEAEVARVRASYEAKPAVRISRRAHAVVEAAPRPVSVPLRALMRVAARAFSRP